MTTPGFSAEAALGRSRTQHALKDGALAPTTQQVEPAQETCSTTYGRCTGFWGTSTAYNSGYRQFCNAAFQYAWLQVCRSGWGGPITSVSGGCGVCAW